MHFNLKENLFIYFIITLIFSVGIALGALNVKGMTYSDKQNLFIYLNNFFQVVNNEKINSFSIFIRILKNNLLMIILIWILSFTYFGFLFSILILLYKGFSLGFTIAFILQSFGLKGFLFIILSLLPQNLFYIPAFLFICSISFIYSLSLFKKPKNLTVNGNFLNFSFNMLFLLLFVFLGNVVESFISPYIIKLLSTYLAIQ
ncbi:stage II sporulation protein M [Caloramator fervidus]|uniref:Stage II sporulation protein M n=1 Tax=Caloramator fervidus TaxID=29344 RepID=A0A1H5V5S1_9CLOT|nr:stage II sporulation protein M [Caloramator fervidus]SEF82725.1 stage II sporulation protein M [Caloramator fervidus]